MEITIPTLLRIKPNAINKIGKYLRADGYNEVALYYGEGIKDFLAEKVQVSFDSSEIKISHEAVTSTNEIDDIFHEAQRIPQRVKAVVAIGGGKAIDYCKYLAFVNQLPVVVVPTIISNDGFASPFSSLVVNGKRRTVKTIIPHGVLLDTEILRKSPEKFLYSGIGDLFCKYTAVFDWKEAFRKRGRPLNDFAAVISLNAADTFYYYPNKDFANLEYLRIIASSLLMTGVAMEIAGSSRPASGSEHLISHAYDRISSQPSLHGLQVGVASYAVSYLQSEENHQRLRNSIESSGFLQFMGKNPLIHDDFIESVKHAPGIKDDFYTVLSEKGSIERLVEWIESDEYMKRMLA